MNARIVGLAAVTALTLGTGCGITPSRHEVEVRKNWPAAGLETLKVTGTNGRVDVTADPKATEITMVAQCRVGKTEDADDILTMDVKGTTLAIAEKERKNRRFLFGRETKIDYEFRVPEGIKLRIDNVNGRIEVDGVDAKMELTTVNGPIEVTTPSGELVARTVNGSVRADFLERFPGARLKTVNGSVKVRVPRDCRVNPEIHQVNGSFRSDIPVTINSGGMDEESLEVTTVNGSVTLSELNGLDIPELPEVPATPEATELPAAPVAPAPPAPPAAIAL
ncbi:MAG: DUF4097 family beta strand repeat protein [Acidobacteria bacterium]|nr:DUF4097 family beta strand repeat protein [Acidobacteriota bacterium]